MNLKPYLFAIYLFLQFAGVSYGQTIMSENLREIFRNNDQMVESLPTISEYKNLMRSIRITKDAASTLDSADFVTAGENKILIKVYSQDNTVSVINRYHIIVNDGQLYSSLKKDFTIEIKEYPKADLSEKKNSMPKIVFKDLPEHGLRMILDKSATE